jgi:AcrR family transcriptional regulator
MKAAASAHAQAAATPVKTAASHRRPRRSSDRRIARSRAALRQALIDSMEECGFEAVTVNDLCARADVTRGTFYNHFKDKEELLASMENEVMAGLAGFQERMAGLEIADVMGYLVSDEPLPFLVELFDYLRSEGAFLHAVMGPGGDIRFSPRLRDSVCTCLVESILHKRYRENPTPFVGYYVSFYASAYLGIITRWIDRGMVESSEEMARIAVRLLFIEPGESIEL